MCTKKLEAKPLMKKIHIIISIIFIFHGKNLQAAELTTEASWNSLKSSMSYLYQVSFMQFTAQNNLYTAFAAVPSI